MRVNGNSFQWTKPRVIAAEAIAEGYLVQEAAERAGVTPRTVSNWQNNSEFTAEVDRLTMQYGLALKSERVRALKRIARNKVEAEGWTTGKDLLDVLRELAKETSEVELGLVDLLTAISRGDG